MNERITRRNESLPPIFERLRRMTIYSEKDFKPPQQILQHSLELNKYRDNDPDAFVRETTILFSNFSRSNKTSDIDVNNLIATLFALRDNPDKTKYRFPDGIKQIEIGLLIDSLLGKNLDFIVGKKESSIILPAYLILRSLKENISLWSLPFLGRSKDIEQTIQLKNGLLGSIHTNHTRQVLEKRFQRSLGISEEKSIGTPEKPNRKLLAVPAGFRSNTLESVQNYPSTDPLSDFNLLKIRPNIKDSAILSDERIFMDLILQNGIISINENGQISISKKSLDKILDIMKDDEDMKAPYDRLKTILELKNSTSLLGSASLITQYSDDGRPDSASWFFAKHKDPQHVVRLIKAFDHTLFTSFKKIGNYESVGLDKAVEETGLFNFTQINRQLASELYKSYFGKPDPTNADLETFVKLPGIDSAIMSLRKLSLIRILNRTLIQINYDHAKLLEPYLIPSSEIAPNIDPQIMIDLAQGKFDSVSFQDLTQVDIIKQLAYYSIEKYLMDNKKGLNKNRTLRAKGDFEKREIRLFIPDDLEPGKLNIFDSTGLPLPINTVYDVDNNKLDLYFYDIYLGRVLVEVEKT